MTNQEWDRKFKRFVFMLVALVVCAVLGPLFTSCGYASDYITNATGREPRFDRVDPQFAPYVAEFNKACGVPVGITIPMGFAKLGNAAGECIEWRVGTRDYEEIAIDPRSWEQMNEAQRWMLVAHELGHCLLNRNHDDSYIRPGYPTSVMISSVPINADSLLRAHKQYYINELCGG